MHRLCSKVLCHCGFFLLEVIHETSIFRTSIYLRHAERLCADVFLSVFFCAFRFQSRFCRSRYFANIFFPAADPSRKRLQATGEIYKKAACRWKAEWAGPPLRTSPGSLPFFAACRYGMRSFCSCMAVVTSRPASLLLPDKCKGGPTH